MIDTPFRERYETAAAETPVPRDVEAAARDAKQGDMEAAHRLAASFAHVGFAGPEWISAVYDAFALGWLGASMPPSHVVPALGAAALPPPDLWDAFWQIIADAGPAMLAGEITARVAALGGLTAPSFQDRAEAAANIHPGAAGAAERAMPEPLTLAMLAGYPAGSLADSFRRLIVDNKFDLEVLDREAIGLGALPRALRYLNTRILQMHDIWHLVAGYRTTVLHEIAISSFQLAQFGHNYSAMFLATVATALAVAEGPGLPVVLHVMADAWRHGRASPSFMAIAWEEEWRLSVADIRRRHAIQPFESLFPADLIEQLRSAAE